MDKVKPAQPPVNPDAIKKMDSVHKGKARQAVS